MWTDWNCHPTTQCTSLQKWEPLKRWARRKEQTHKTSEAIPRYCHIIFFVSWNRAGCLILIHFNQGFLLNERKEPWLVPRLSSIYPTVCFVFETDAIKCLENSLLKLCTTSIALTGQVKWSLLSQEQLPPSRSLSLST